MDDVHYHKISNISRTFFTRKLAYSCGCDLYIGVGFWQMFISEMLSNSRSAAQLPWASVYCITLSFSAYEQREKTHSERDN